MLSLLVSLSAFPSTRLTTGSNPPVNSNQVNNPVLPSSRSLWATRCPSTWRTWRCPTSLWWRWTWSRCFDTSWLKRGIIKSTSTFNFHTQLSPLNFSFSKTSRSYLAVPIPLVNIPLLLYLWTLIIIVVAAGAGPVLLVSDPQWSHSTSTCTRRVLSCFRIPFEDFYLPPNFSLLIPVDPSLCCLFISCSRCSAAAAPHLLLLLLTTSRPLWWLYHSRKGIVDTDSFSFLFPLFLFPTSRDAL